MAQVGAGCGGTDSASAAPAAPFFPLFLPPLFFLAPPVWGWCRKQFPWPAPSVTTSSNRHQSCSGCSLVITVWRWACLKGVTSQMKPHLASMGEAKTWLKPLATLWAAISPPPLPEHMDDTTSDFGRATGPRDVSDSHIDVWAKWSAMLSTMRSRSILWGCRGIPNEAKKAGGSSKGFGSLIGSNGGFSSKTWQGHWSWPSPCSPGPPDSLGTANYTKTNGTVTLSDMTHSWDPWLQLDEANKSRAGPNKENWGGPTGTKSQGN